MPLVHYSPRLKRLAKCSGNCAFDTEHFSSMADGEAWLAKQAEETYGTLPKTRKKKNESRNEARSTNNVDNLAYQAAAQELVDVFRTEKGYTLPDQKFDTYAIDMMSDHPSFEYLGTGADKTAFLHRETGLVYKVIFARAGNGEHQLPYLRRYVEKEQQLIAEVDDKLLAEHSVRYAKNYFLEFDGIPVIAQEYLSPEEYEDYPLDIDLPDLNERLEQHGLSDMHADNVKRNVKTGEIVLFDCLQLGGHVIGEVTGELL